MNGSTVGSEAKTPVTMAVTAVNDAPVISGLDGIAFTLGGATQFIDTNTPYAQVTDTDNVNFAGGNLTISYKQATINAGLNNGSFRADGATITTDGGNGLLFVIGANVLVNGVAIGTVASDGQGTNALVITLNASAMSNTYDSAANSFNDNGNISVLLQYLQYTAATKTGDRVFDVTITDGASGATSVTSTVTMTGTNTAPVLTSGNTYTLTSTNEETNSSGTLVSAIVDAGVGYSDADNDGTFTPTKGMAVTATTGNGTWQYSTDGTNWTGFGSVSDSAALLLSATTQVRYAPDTHNGETPNFTFRAWDTTDGSNEFAKVDTTTNGNTTAFSANTATASIVVSSVNDAPSGTDKTITVNEDTAYTFTASDFGFSDTIDSPANTLNHLKITTLPSVGTLKLSGVAVNAGDFVSVANIANLTFTPAANANGTGYANFTFQVEDNGGTNNGGVNLDANPNTIAVDVTAVNDAPTGANVTLTTNEDTQLVLTAANFGYSDIENSTFASVKITTLENVGALKLNGVDVTQDQVITKADIDSSLLTFDPVANANGTNYTNFAFKVNDGTDFSVSANTVTIDVTAVNDLPTAVNATLTTNEDTQLVLTAANFGYSDIEASALASVKITTLESAGALKLNGFDVTLNQIITKSDIDSGKLTFDPAVNANGTNYATFEFKVNDGTDFSNAANSVTVHVTPIADTPSITDATTTSGQITSSGLVISRNAADSTEVTHFKITNIANGTLFKFDGSTPVTAGSFITYAEANAGLKFTPSGSTAGTFDLQASTSNADGGLGGSVVTAHIAIGVGVASPTINEDVDSGAIAITGTDAYYKITGITGGTLYSDSGYNSAISDNAFITGINPTTNVYFRPTTDFNGSAGFTVQGSSTNNTDNTGLTGSPSTSTITITPVNDVPSFTKGGDQTVNEDASATTVSGWATSLSAGGNESQTLSFDVTNDNTSLFSSQPSIDSSGNLTYTPASNANGLATVSVKIKDNGGTENGGVDTSATQTFTITVTAQNDAPTVTAGTSSATLVEASGVANGTTGTSTATITLTKADVDGTTPTYDLTGWTTPDSGTTYTKTGAYGTATLTVATDVVSYALDNSLTATQALIASSNVSDSFDVGVTDGSLTGSVAAVFNITGANDNPTVTAASQSAQLVEIGNNVAGTSTATIALTKGDVDGTASYDSTALVAAGWTTANGGTTYTKTGTYGTATLTVATDVVSYSLDDSANATQALTAGQSVSDTFAIGVTDGTLTDSVNAVFSITGTNDAPTLTAVTQLTGGTEDTEKTISFSDLQTAGDEADVDGSVASFTVKAVTSGTLKIGANSATAVAWDALTNNTIDTSHLAYWTPAVNANGSLGAFTVIAKDDSGIESATAIPVTVTVAAVNDAPTATNLSTAESYTEDTALNLTDIVITDVDSATVTATLTLSNTAAGSFNTATSNSVTSTFNAGVWSASGAKADVNTLLAGVIFTPTLNFNSDFTVSSSISDGTASPITGNKNFTGIAVNDVPVFTKGANQTVLEDAGTQTVTEFATGISKGATNESAQTLTFNLSTGGNDSAFSTLPTINAAGDLTYTFADNYNGVVTVSATLSDNGGGTNTSTAQTFTLTATSVNDLPIIGATTTTSTFTENGTGGTAVNLLGGTITVSDVDNTDFNSGNLSVKLNNYVTGDVLSIANGNNIALSNSIVSYNSNAIATISGGTGNDLTITFNSVNATPTAVQALLGQITFANTTDDPTNKGTNPTRVATLVLNDSAGNSTPLSASITVTGENDNPTVTLTGGNAIYSAQSPAIAVDTGLILADLDNTALNQTTITLNTPPDGNSETLGLTTSATTLADEKGLTITPYNSSTHELVISGNAAISDYETVLHGVTYVNVKTTPDMNDRTVSFSVRDSANGNTTTAPSRTIFYDRPPTQQHDVGITVNQGATGTITTSLLEYTDSVTSPVIYTIATLPTHGSLFKNSVLLLANDTFTQSDIDTNKITYGHLGTAHSYVGVTESDSFAFTSSVGRTNSFGTELKATGTFNITANLLNGAPVLTAAFPILTAITEDETSPTDYSVSSILGSSIYDLDKDNAATQNTAGVAVFAADSVNGKWQYALNTGGSFGAWTDIGSISESNALLLGSTDKIRFLPNGQNGVGTALSYYAWDRSDSKVVGTYANATTRGGNTAFSVNAENTVLKVASVNDAPVIATGTHTLASTNEDVTSTAVSITTLLDGLSYNDVDNNALQGVAIIGTTGSGTWQFTTETVITPSTVWTNMPANTLLSNSNALLLDKPNSVRFIPDNNWNGDAGLTLKAWDQTVGTPSLSGEPVTFNVGEYSATGSFSQNTATANLSVLAVNDAPTSIVPTTTTEAPLTIQEDGTLTFNSANENALAISDNIDTEQFLATDNLTATVSVLHGKLTVATNSGATVSNDNSNNVVITGSTAQINAALEGLVYAPLLNYNGADTLTLLTSDNGNTDHSDLAHPASAITPLTVTKTVNLSVTAVNDAPVASGSSTLAAILEDNTNPVGASVSALFQANFSDSKDQLKPTGYSDANTFAGIAIVGYTPDSSAGNWQYQIDNGAWTSLISSLSLSNALSLKITDNLRFVPAANYNGTPPALTTILIDSSVEGIFSGEISSYAEADIGALGGISAYSSGTVLLTTNIIPVNDDPSFINGANQIVKEDSGNQTVTNFISIFSKGPDNENYQDLTFTVTNSNNTLFSVQPSINSSGTLTYTPAMNANGSTTVTVYLTDSENGTTATQTFTITVQPVNDAPTQTVPVAQSVDEDSSLTLSHFTVSDELDTKQAATDNLTTTLTVQHGKLTASTATGNDSDSISITGSAAQINAALNGLIYKPNANYNGKDSLTVLTSDNGNTGGGALSVSNTIEITVNPVNDAPVITSKETISSVAENSPLETIVYTVSATDIDEGQKLSYSLSGQDANSFAINATTGVVTLKAAANFEVKNSYQFNVVATDDDKKPLSDVKAITINVTDVDEVPVAVSDGYKTNEDTALNITATQGVLAKSSAANANTQLSAILVKNPANGTLILEKNGAFTYQPNPNFSGVDSFTYKASDGKLDSDLVVVSLTVQPVNDAPSFKIGENQKVQSIAGKQTVTEWASEINAGINESDQIVSFQVTNDNEALFSLQPTIDNTGTLTYTPAEGANGSATIRVFAKDNGGIDNAGIDTSAEQSAVIVIESLTNAAPILTSATTFELPEKTTAIATITASDKDGDLLNYSLAGGTNQDLFTLDSATGNLAFKTPVLFDTKPDSTNSYNVSVSVSDGKVSDTQNVTITVLPDLDSDGKADKYDDDIDGDGILNIAEDKIPNPSGGNFGDANSDGILDSYQLNVGAIKTIANDKNGSPRYAAFSVADGLSIQNITNSVAKNLPKGTTLPLGAFGLTVGNVPIGGDATITMTVSPDVVMNGYLKQNNTGQWVKLPITLGGDTTKKT
ncbi:MAG: tandem-95 repeat protein, partial [Methylococcales bacterium]|nr:tandem-95 repeat protein [Methylococcales bacterium]